MDNLELKTFCMNMLRKVNDFYITGPINYSSAAQLLDITCNEQALIIVELAWLIQQRELMATPISYSIAPVSDLQGQCKVKNWLLLKPYLVPSFARHAFSCEIHRGAHTTAFMLPLDSSIILWRLEHVVPRGLFPNRQAIMKAYADY